MAEEMSQPGAAWREIVSRETLQAFSQAFVTKPVLEATVVTNPLLGVRSIHDFFRATRLMFDRIEFVHEARSASRVCLEWQGMFQSREISGATILALDTHGAIEHLRLYHFPFHQISAFSAELTRRLAADRDIGVEQFNDTHPQNNRQRVVRELNSFSTNGEWRNE